MKGLEYAIQLMDKNFGSGMRKAKQQTQGMDSAMSKVNNNIGRTKGISQNSFGSLINVAKKAAIVLGGVFAIGSLISFGNEVTTITAQFEGMNNAIEFASGQDGGKNIEFLDNTIKTLNLDMAASYKGFQTLTGAMKGTKLEGQGVRDIFDGVATAATVMNLTGEQAEGAFLALSQMASKGKVSAEELRGQLGERIPGALKIAADSMGVSQMKFNDLLDSGKIYAEDFLPKFSKQLKETFQDGLPKAANSMQAAINQKNNAMLSFKRNFGEAFRPVLTEVLKVGAKFFEFLGKMLQHLDPVKTALKGVWDALEPLRATLEKAQGPFLNFAREGTSAEQVMNGIAKAIQYVTPLIGFLAEVFGVVQEQIIKVRNVIWEKVQALNEAGTASEFLGNALETLRYIWELLKPAISAVGDVLAFVVGLVMDYIGVWMSAANAMFEFGRKTEWIRKLLNALQGSVKGVFTNIKEIIMNTLGSVADLLVGVFTLDIDKIKSGFMKAMESQKGVVKQYYAGLQGASEGWNKELEKPITKDIEVGIKGKQQAPKSMVDYLAGLDGKTKDPVIPTLNPTADKSVSGGGGSSTKHTTFNIQSFVKELTIKVDSIKESPQDIKRQLTQVFNEWVADLELRADVT